ncbi:MAG: hypothetical protein EOP92_17375, partial [Lysobacteraceae bacterium]
PTPPPPPAPAPQAESAKAAPGQADTAGQAAASSAMPAAVAWWNLLQDQFRQAVSSAMPAPGASPESHDKAPDSAEKAPPAEPKARGGSPLDVSGGAEPAPPTPPGGNGRVGRNPRVKADKG